MYTNRMVKETVNANNQAINREIYSVSSLNKQARQILEKKFNEVWIEGEVSNLAMPSSGHIYFKLKDQYSQISCAMFRQKNRSINFPLEDGRQVLVKGKVSLYEIRGDFQVIVDYIEESGEGVLRRRYEELKKKLKAEGLFDENIKKAFPKIPKKIGVITSPTGAAIKDVLSILNRRFPIAPVIIYPTSVQGKNSVTEIIEAIKIAESRKECDVIILTRGGGSIEDLWSFNEEDVARAIANLSIPIIVGVGHEVDSTIADFVADKRAPTPSGAAEIITPDAKALSALINNQSKRLIRIVNTTLNLTKNSFSNIIHRLKISYPGIQIKQFSQRIDDLENRSYIGISRKIEKSIIKIDKLIAGLRNLSPKKNIIRFRDRLAWISENLTRTIFESIENKNMRIKLVNQTLKAVNPLATLDRGYAIVSLGEEKTIISDSSQLSIGSKINLRLSKGEASAEIKKIKK